MWLTIWTGGDAVMDRPLCRLVHYLLGVDALCLIAAQGLALILLGPQARVGVAWFVATVVLILAHAAFAFLFAWIDGEEIHGEPDIETFTSDGSGGDGSSSD